MTAEATWEAPLQAPGSVPAPPAKVRPVGVLGIALAAPTLFIGILTANAFASNAPVIGVPVWMVASVASVMAWLVPAMSTRRPQPALFARGLAIGLAIYLPTLIALFNPCFEDIRGGCRGNELLSLVSTWLGIGWWLFATAGWLTGRKKRQGRDLPLLLAWSMVWWPVNWLFA